MKLPNAMAIDVIYIPYSQMLNPFSVGASQICKYNNALTNFICALALIGLVSTQPPFTGR
jgi:hypothetical protein